MLKDDSTPIIHFFKKFFRAREFSRNRVSDGEPDHKPTSSGTSYLGAGAYDKDKRGETSEDTVKNVRSRFNGRGWDFNHLSDTF